MKVLDIVFVVVALLLSSSSQWLVVDNNAFYYFCSAHDDDGRQQPARYRRLLSSSSSKRRRRRRQVWAWAGGKHGTDSQIKQLRNSTWSSIIDGIQAWCGCYFTDDDNTTTTDGGGVGTGIYLNETMWHSCLPLKQAADDANVKFQLMISPSVPQHVIDDPSAAIKDAIELYHRLDIDGFSLDDEHDCAPRSTTDQFAEWMKFHNTFTTALSIHEIPVTSAIQAIFGIQEHEDNKPCQYKPSMYEFDPKVIDAFHNTTVEKWLVMDTYYFTTGRFLGALDWYAEYFPLNQLGIGIQNRSNELSVDDVVARFYAINRYDIDWINIFMMPVAELYLPFLQRYKTYCIGCGRQTSLGCYDMTIDCDNNFFDIAVADVSGLMNKSRSSKKML